MAAKPKPAPRPRPWSSAVAPMDAQAEGVLPPSLPDGALAAGAAARRVLFPSEDESTGIVSMAWRGPPYAAHGTWLML